MQCSSSAAHLLPSPNLSSSRSGGDLYESSEASTALLGLGGSVRGSTSLSRNKELLPKLFIFPYFVQKLFDSDHIC